MEALAQNHRGEDSRNFGLPFLGNYAILLEDESVFIFYGIN